MNWLLPDPCDGSVETGSWLRETCAAVAVGLAGLAVIAFAVGAQL